MSQFDQQATPVLMPFKLTPDLSPYKALPESVHLNARNHEKGTLAKLSNQMDFSNYDLADPDLLNYVLWHAAHRNRPMPAPTRSAHVIR